MRAYGAALMAALVLGVSAFSACNSAPTGPDAESAPEDTIVIEIVRTDGARSFAPNFVTVPDGRAVVWHDADFQTHHIVLDAGGLDTGDIRPGRFSEPMVANGAGRYHCTIHPSMIGTLQRDE